MYNEHFNRGHPAVIHESNVLNSYFQHSYSSV